MFSVRIHGRGGQGVVTAAELLAVAAFVEERYAQAFPSFGSERTGAPVAAFCRVDDRPIRSHEPVVAPDAILVADPTVMHQVDVLAGLRPDGYLLVNSAGSAPDFAQPGARLTLVPATELAMQHIGRPLPNAVLLGAFAALTGVVRLDSVCAAIRERFPARIAERNIAAATAAWHNVHNGLKVASDA
ncbi:MAG: 2-oxoacid:acceptor oxidoreductase family protein [Micromonosporaceae bacterium]|nr:2-oxoacid:acceptor oxidoreductase family protein [Micromonosporaceae bacterium]